MAVYILRAQPSHADRLPDQYRKTLARESRLLPDKFIIPHNERCRHKRTILFCLTISIKISLRPGINSLPRYRERDLLFTTARAKNLEPGRGQWPAIEVPAIVVGYTRTGIASGRGIGAPVTGAAILPAPTQPGHHPTGGIATGTTRSTAPGTIGMANVAATSEELPAAEVQLAPDSIP